MIEPRRLINSSQLLWRRRAWLGLLGLPLTDWAPAQTPVVLRVGFLRDHQPYSFFDTQTRVQGFDVEVAQHIAEQLHGRLEIVTDSYSGLTRRLQAGEIDWIGNQLLATPDNRKNFDLVRPAYASIQLSAIQHEDDERDFLSLEELKGKQLGVLAQAGIQYQTRGALTVRPYTQIEQALKDLADKKLDAVLEENLIVDYLIAKHGWPLKVAAPFAAPSPVGLAVRKGDEARRAQLSATVAQMLRDGSLARIAKRWFGYDVSRSRVSHL
jgi:cystine transport system substrate-binding protein